MLIGERLEKIREKVNRSKGEMAESLGLEQGSYSDIIRGKTKGISKSVMLLLEILYNVNLEFLKTEEGEMFKSGSKKHDVTPQPIIFNKLLDMYEERLKDKDTIIKDKEVMLRDKETIIEMMQHEIDELKGVKISMPKTGKKKVKSG